MSTSKTQSLLFTNSDLEIKLKPGAAASRSSVDYNGGKKEARQRYRKTAKSESLKMAKHRISTALGFAWRRR